LLVLIDYCLCLELLEPNYFIFLELISLYLVSCSHYCLCVKIKAAFVEKLGHKVQVFHCLKTFKFVGVPETYLSIYWYTYKLTLLVEEKELHNFLIMYINVFWEHGLTCHIIQHQVSLLASYCVNLLFLTKCWACNWDVIFLFLAVHNCRIINNFKSWNALLMPTFLKVHRFIHPEESIVEGNKCSNDIVKLEAWHWLNLFVLSAIGCCKISTLRQQLLKFELHKLRTIRVCNNNMHLASTNKNCNLLLWHSMKANFNMGYNKASVI